MCVRPRTTPFVVLAPVEELLLVVAADDERAGPASDVEHAARVRSARDQIADEDETVAAGETNAIEESFRAPAGSHGHRRR